MSDQLDKKSILEMSMGAILERVDYEMGKVMDNILDPNTKATAKRKISVTLELIPSADRRTITVQSTAKCSLTPTDPVTTSLYITNAPSTGELMVAEMVPQVPGQLALDGDGNVGLFEADGGMWQQTAKASIAAYFEDKLAQEVKDGKIVVMM
jgi:hypothetical protein